MKQIDLMKDGENLGWCRPFCATKKEGRYWLVMDEGRPMIVNPIHGTVYNPSAAGLKQFAKDVNPRYHAYIGYTDIEIATSVMTEVGCDACPFRYECEAMLEEIEG